MFSTTRTVTRITKVEGEIPSSDILKAVRSLYNFPVNGQVKVTVKVPYEDWDVQDCQFFVEWVESVEEEEASDA